MNIIIRADASIHIGTGHVMRCLTLADELKKRGSIISFICREEKGNLTGFIRNKNYKVYTLPADIDIETDRELTKKTLEQEHPDWLIIDHYGIDSTWESSLRKLVKKIMVIDDLADRKHDCDLLLDQNFNLNDNRYSGLLPEKCIKLLGPKYALLRQQFIEARKKLKERTHGIRRILIFMGGADQSNQTCKALDAVKMLGRSDIAIDIVIGTANPNRDKIENLADNIPDTTCHFNVTNMAELMVKADISIGAGGTSSWERCCLGLPGLIITIADNQKEIARALNKNGCCIDLGWHKNVTDENIKKGMEDLLTDPSRTTIMSRKCLDLVDGSGSSRVSNILLNN